MKNVISRGYLPVFHATNEKLGSGGTRSYGLQLGEN